MFADFNWRVPTPCCHKGHHISPGQRFGKTLAYFNTTLLYFRSPELLKLGCSWFFDLISKLTVKYHTIAMFAEVIDMPLLHVSSTAITLHKAMIWQELSILQHCFVCLKPCLFKHEIFDALSSPKEDVWLTYTYERSFCEFYSMHNFTATIYTAQKLDKETIVTTRQSFFKTTHTHIFAIIGFEDVTWNFINWRSWWSEINKAMEGVC